MDCKKIGEYIKGKRKEVELTQAELGDMLGVTSKAVSKWETGVALPDVSLFIELCTILKIDVSELLNGEDNKKISIAKKKNILIVILSIFLILFLITSLFLGIYFIKTCDSVNVYDLVSEKNIFHVDGKLIEIGDTTYLIISKVKYVAEKKNEMLYAYNLEYEISYNNQLLYKGGNLDLFEFNENSEKITVSKFLSSIFVFKEIDIIEDSNLDCFILKISLLTDKENVDSFAFKLRIK